MTSKDYLIFSSEKCPYCIKAINLLTAMGESFVVKYPSDYETLDMFKADAIRRGAQLKQGRFQVPQIFYDGVYIGGFKELAESV